MMNTPQAQDLNLTPYSVKRFYLIYNPVAGTNRQALDTIEQVLRENGSVEWEVFETKESGDARRFAQKAVEDGVDAVAACGGDGTVMEVADGLHGSEVPMAIFPAGTANVMSVELGISSNLQEAVALLITDTCHTRRIDMGKLGDRHFLLRAGIGLEAELAATPRESKKRFGRLAYIQWTLHQLRRLRPTRYTIQLDGRTEKAYGISCMIANSTNSGIPRLNVAEADVADGMLDVVVFRNAQLPEILRVLVNIFRGLVGLGGTSDVLLHWRGRDIEIRTSRRQRIAVDGELMGRKRHVHAHIVPGAVRVIVPYTSPENETAPPDEEAQDSAGQRQQ